jgi:hypothetical protein
MRALGALLIAALLTAPCAVAGGLLVAALEEEIDPGPPATASDRLLPTDKPVRSEVSPSEPAAGVPILRGRALPDGDPWLESDPDGARRTSTREAHETPIPDTDSSLPPGADRELSRWGCLVTVGGSGDLSFDSRWWSASYGREGYQLVVYDLAPLEPTARDLCEALRGCRQEGRAAAAGSPRWDGRAAAAGSPWWRSLCENIVRAVGRNGWPTPATLLAWDSRSAMLYVRQDADGQCRVEEYLETLARARLGTIGLEVQLDAPPEGVGALALQVPWGRSVRAHQGSTYLYVQDFDIEVAQDTFIPDPIVEHVDTGFAVSARRLEGREYAGDLDVEIAYSDAPPRFTRFETTLANPSLPVCIEIPTTYRACWRGLVSAAPGAHAIRLDDGRLVTLTVRGDGGSAPAVGGLVRRELHAASAEQGAGSRAEHYLHIAWEVPGEQFTYDMELVPRDRALGSSRGDGWVVATGGAVTASTATGIWPPPDGGLRIHAAVLHTGDVDVVDLDLERAWSAADVRFPGGAPLGTVPSEPRWPRLTANEVRADAFRVLLHLGDEACVAVRGASGRTGLLRLTRFTFAHNP